MLISTSKIVGKTVVVRVRRCVVGDFFFVLKSLMWGIARPRQSLQGLDNTASAYCSCFCLLLLFLLLILLLLLVNAWVK